MKTIRTSAILRVTLLAMCLGGLSASAQQTAIPADGIRGLETALESVKEGSSEARKRLAVKRVVRDAEKLLESHPDAPNRFEALDVLFRARQTLVAIDGSPDNRKALLETCRHLAAAPDEYAAQRLDADLLLSQAELVRQGADAATRAKALVPLVGRYRDTPVEAKALRIALVMALELGDQRRVDELREVMEERFASDLGMIAFQRDKLGGQVFGAPFCGVFERSDGRMMRFPMDAMGRTTTLFFWSMKTVEELKAFAAGWLATKPTIEGRFAVVSINLDDLPDAGASILREAGVDWPALKLPGGRKSPYFDAFARADPRIVTLSPTGIAPMLMLGGNSKPKKQGARPDYVHYFNSSLSRLWTFPEYVQQLASVLAGDIFVIDPSAPFDPALPPEMKAAGSKKAPLRAATSVPEEKLAAIQECFLVPPFRYRAPIAELKTGYEKAEGLCREAIAAHPAAPDLWIVRNRRIIALLNLWMLEANLDRFDEAVAEARAALAAKPPTGADVIPRFVLAREKLRHPGADPGKVIDGFLEEAGKESGPALAAAALLALDVADRVRHERFRKEILDRHAGNPGMWTIVSFLHDRYQRYWLYQVPYTAGWSFVNRLKYYLASGEPEEPGRSIVADLRTLDGETFRIPEDTRGKWTAIVFAAPWGKEGPPERNLKILGDFAAKRPTGDMQVILVVLEDDAEKVRALVSAKPPACPVMLLPGGMKHPLVRRLGLLAQDQRPNSLLLHPDGTVAVMISGLVARQADIDRTAPAVIQTRDEREVGRLLEQGDLEGAKRLIFTLAPPYDPNAVDAKGRKPGKPEIGLPHLRARAQVYMALGEWDKALADAEELVDRQTGKNAGMSLRTRELDAAEQMREEIIARREAADQSGGSR